MTTLIRTKHRSDDLFADIITDSASGWVIALPVPLRGHQAELEALLGKVFAERSKSVENLALAKQLSMNWCFSKCKQTGVNLEDCGDTSS
jgi:hypothetical protein